MQINNILASTPAAGQSAQVMVFTSGKGGVGKTSVAANVATAIARRGGRVCLFDADTGLANINILLGLRPEFTLEQVIDGQKSIRDIVVETPQGVSVVPGASGVEALANLDPAGLNRLSAAMAELEADYDYFLIDTAAGVADNVLKFIQAAPYTFLLITQEPTSLTDAFALLKLLHGRAYPGRLRVIVNMAGDYAQATETFRRFAAAAEKYLQLQVEYGGFVADDAEVAKSVLRQTPIVESLPNAPASRCLYALADNIMRYLGAEAGASGWTDYWRNLLAEVELSPASAAVSGPVPDGSVTEAESQTLEALCRRVLAALKNHGGDQPQLQGFFGDFLTAYVDALGVYPPGFEAVLFRWLEAEDYAGSKLQELVANLEVLYMLRHQQPLFSVETHAARLVAASQGDEARLRGLIGQLRSAYRQAFKTEVFDAKQELVDGIARDDFHAEDFQQLLDVLLSAYRRRFGQPYKGQSELLLELTAEKLQEINAGEQNLKRQVDGLQQSAAELRQQREALLAALQTAAEANLTPDRLTKD